MIGSEHGISVCPWRGDKRWVYSITFDEALSDLHRFTIPILAEYGVPGHLESSSGRSVKSGGWATPATTA